MSKIEWCDITLNPIVGCSKCSPGYAKCYDLILNLVSEMRGAQNDYFRNRTLTMLNICKSLEKRVDAEIKRRKSHASSNQISLFNVSASQ